MKLLIIACSVLKNEFLATNPDGVHIEFLEQGLHQTPDKMRLVIQEKIDEVNSGGFDYILLGYGLCGNGTLGIKARDIPVVIPKALMIVLPTGWGHWKGNCRSIIRRRHRIILPKVGLRRRKLR